MQILSFPEAETPPPLRAQVWELQQEAWPPVEPGAEGEPRPVHDPALRPLTMLLVDSGDGTYDGEQGGGVGGGTVLAALDILTKTITHVGRSYRAGGLSTVVTRRAVRGRGYGARLVAAAHQAMAASGLDLGVFTCDRELQDFYTGAGWQPLPGTVLIGGTPEAPFPSDRPSFDKVTMADFFSAAARCHRADFVSARIELYPGEIDRLW
ncbi:GNAT family N-acetyltransferase [Streptomyces sp. 205]|uniref:GNAT family N-acetyltransferase n=1 Tax=Streptomyces coffeae TaxID=621382 RepID=A0ABS1NBP7_9ACTN|nr:GNAT family N-acetyltransferase [Streptomyces coffeae]